MSNKKPTAAPEVTENKALQTYFLPATQLARIERAILTAGVVGGYLANGGRPTTPSRVNELAEFVEMAEAVLRGEW